VARSGADSIDRAVARSGADSIDRVVARSGADSIGQVVARGGADSNDRAVARGGADSIDRAVARGGADSIDRGVARSGADSIDRGVARSGADRASSKPTRPQDRLIVHICSRPMWEGVQQRGLFRPEDVVDASSAAASANAPFIHCARPDQVLQVANRWFKPQAETHADLVLLWIDPQWVAAANQAEVRWEEADGDRYPHIYGPLSLDAVVAVSAFSPDPDGVYRQTPEI